MKRLLPVVLIVGCLLLRCGARALAQNQSADPGKSVAFEEIPSALLDTSQPVRKKMSELLGTVEIELSAGHVSEEVAQDLRSAIAGIPPLIETEFPAALSTPQLNTADEAIAKAAADLESAWKLCASRRAALLRQADSEARERVSKVAATAKRTSDVGPLLETLLRIQASPPKRFGRDRQVIFNAIIFLRTLQETFDPTLMDGFGKEDALLTLLRKEGGDDAKPRIEQRQREYEREVENTHATLDALLLGGAAFEKTWKAFLAYKTASMRRFSPSQEVGVYSSLSICLDRIEKRQWSEAHALIDEARTDLNRFDHARELRFGEFLNQKDAEITKEIESERLREKAKLLADINKAKRPEEIDALAARLRITDPYAPGEGPGGFTQRFPYVLFEMAAGWKRSDPRSFAELLERAKNARERDELLPQIAPLRHRVEHDVWGRFLNAPELNQPPLADLPVRKAIEELCETLSANGNWQRMVELLRARAAVEPLPPKGAASEQVLKASIAFLAGQNLELAEEWADAAAEYKKVVEANLKGTPMEQAAQRLATLKRNHPSP